MPETRGGLNLRKPDLSARLSISVFSRTLAGH